MMARPTYASLAVAALIAWNLAACAEGADGKDPAKRGTGAIVGRVVDLHGRPVAGAEVWAVALWEWDPVSGKTTSDAEGRFRLDAIPEDKTVTVWAGAEGQGLARERRDDVRVFAGRDRDIGTFALAPGTRIKGRVVDAAGQPIRGAEITLDVSRRYRGRAISAEQTSWTLTSDPMGRFHTPPLPAGRAHIRIGAPGKVETNAYHASTPGTAEVELGDHRLNDAYPIRGIVVDQDGHPVPGVKVFLDYDYEHATTTDAEGRFTVDGAVKDVEELFLQSYDYFTNEPFPIGPNRNDVRLEVRKAYTIQGTVVDAVSGDLVPIESLMLCTVERDPDDGNITFHG